jgi:hypothetical protein
MTLDEVWNVGGTDWDWNVLEKDLVKRGQYVRAERSFGLREFLSLIKVYFVPTGECANLDRGNASSQILHNAYWNSCVSCALLQKR